MRFIDLYAEYRTIKKAVNRAISRTIKEGNFILGENVATLEEKIADYVGAKYAVGVNSGTDALYIALKILGIGKGDEVVTTPFTFVATAEMIMNAGATPIFADINPRTFNIEASQIEKAITKRTKAIIPVHLYGQMADMESIRHIAKRTSLFVIEDAAQALGAKQQIADNKWHAAGSAGDIGCFSFFPTKNLGAYGDGGMITLENETFCNDAKMFRNHGAKKKYEHEFLALSSRLDELQAAILLAKFPHLEAWNKKRRMLAAYYTSALQGIPEIVTPFTETHNKEGHIFHQYTIRVKSRDRLREALLRGGIPTSIHYPTPIHLQPALKMLGHAPGDFSEAERAAKEVLSLPLYPQLSRSDQDRVVKHIRTYCRTHHAA